ncbi:MAG: translocation/assembly module TamB [Sphaerochaetaceae bacterium]|nr:translocation/assembly module TamB [Sphaerochaetaceae bacterium]
MESAGLSIGLLDALKIAGGNYNGADVDFSVAEVRLNINQELFDFFAGTEDKYATSDMSAASHASAASDMSATSDASAVSDASSDVSSSSSSGSSPSRSLLESMPGLNFTISGLDISVDIDGISAAVPDIIGVVKFSAGLKYKSANFSSGTVNVALKDESGTHEIVVAAPKVSGTYEHTVLYMESISSSMFGSSGMIAMTLEPSDNGFVTVINANKINLGYESHRIKLERFSAEASIDSSFQNGNVTAYLSNCVYAGEGINAELTSAQISVRDFGTNEIKLDASVTGFNGKTEDLEVLSPSMYLSVDTVMDKGDFFVNINSSSVSATFASEVFTVSTVGANDLFAAIQYNTQTGYLTLNGETLAGGKSSDSLVGSFSAFVSGNTALNAVELLEKLGSENLDLNGIAQSIDTLNVSLANMKTEQINVENHISLTLSDSNTLGLTATVSDSLSMNVDFSIPEETAQLKMQFSDFAPSEYSKIIDRFVPSLNAYIDSKSRIDGSILVNINAIEREYLLPPGVISLNLAARHAKVGSSDVNLAITVEANNLGDDIEVKTLAITAFDYRLSFSGSMDSKNFYPEGSLLLQSASDGSSIAQFDFERNRGGEGYNLKGSVARFNTLLFEGNAVWADEGVIFADCVLRTEHGDHNVDMTIDLNRFSVDVDGDDLSLHADYDGGSVINMNGGIKDLKVYFTDTMFVKVTADIDGMFDLASQKFRFSSTGIYVEVSDILHFGFDITVTDNSFLMSRISVGRKEYQYDFSGEINFTYREIWDFLVFDTSNIVGSVNLNIPGTANHIICSMLDNRYYADIEIVLNEEKTAKLNLLGSRGDGFYAEAGFGDFRFEARLKDRILRLYNTDGRLGTLTVKAFDVVIDFVKRTLSGTTTIENKMENMEGDVYQGATIDFNAKVDSLVIGALSFAGFDVEAGFSIGIRDAYLGDGFTIPDTRFDVTYSRDNISINGDMLSGYVNLSTGTFDIDLSRDFLIGFNAKGSIGETLDVHLSNLSLPIAVVNQFMNMPFAHILSGTVNGELLVKGPVNNLSLYGLLTIQKMEFDIFYFPDQILTLSNLNIVLHDNVVSITPTPLIGHSSADGRYYKATFKMEATLGPSGLESMEGLISEPDEYMDFWMPTYLGPDAGEIDVRGDVRGNVILWVRNGVFGIDLDINSKNFIVDFELPPMPKWFYELAVYCSINLKLETGKNMEFFYPTIDNSFINFTLSENQTIEMQYDSETENIKIDGNIDFKSGRISYLNNDFVITEGNLELKSSSTGALDMGLNLTARLREYADGTRYEIYLILQDATLDNIAPRFESLPALSENEIIKILGQSIIPTTETGVTVSSIASAAVAATDAIQNLGILESNDSFSVARSIRESLGLDVFSIRSNLLGNIVALALPGSASNGKNLSLMARYLDGTSIYVGKYINDLVFARATLLLKADNKNTSDSGGNFLTDDLNLDIEFSFDWENPMGSFSVFTHPGELSVFDILDTIGFSFSKRLTF